MNDKLEKNRNILGRFADIFINQLPLSILVMFMIISVGVFGLMTLPKESLPEIIFPAISVQTVYLGASPEDVEFLVTDPIENKISELDDIENLTSESSFGLSFVTIEFKEDIDVDRKKLELDNLLNEIDFPEGVEKPSSFIFKTSEIPLMNISISGELPVYDLTRVSEDIADEIEKISGVEEVNVFGGLDREIHIITNPVKMLELGVTMDNLERSIQNYNLSTPLGEANLNGLRYTIRTDEKLKDVSEISQIPIKTSKGSMVFVRDFAEIYDSTEKIKSYNRTFIRDGRIAGLPSVFLEVSRAANSDVVGITQKIKQKIEKNSGVLYPESLKINYSNELAENVAEDLKNIQQSALSGLIVVVIVLFLFIGFREAIVVSVTIPLSLLGTLGLLNIFGITFNTFAILGLIVALGLLVDNSIVVMENIDRLKREGYMLKDAASLGTNQVSYPIFSATLTTISAFFPLAILPGILGDFVSTIPLTIIITISVSLIVSLTITPAISSRILKREAEINYTVRKKWFKIIISIILVAVLSFYAFSNGGNWNVLSIVALVFFSIAIGVKEYTKYFKSRKNEEHEKYKNVINAFVMSKKKRIILLFAGFLVLVFSFGTFATDLIKVSFFPKNEPDTLVIDIDTPGGTTLEETAKITEKVEALLIDNKGIDQFNTTIGGSEVDKSVIRASLVVSEGVTGFDLLESVEDELNEISGAEILIKGLASGPPVGAPVKISFSGSDLDRLQEVLELYKREMKQIDGIYNIETSVKKGVPQILMDINPNKAALYDLSVAQISSQVRKQISGITVTTYTENREEINVKIQKQEEDLSEISEIKNLYITLPSGKKMPVENLVKFKEEKGLSSIRHEDSERIVFIEADIRRGYNITDITNQIENRIQGKSIYNDIDISFGGDVQGIQENFIYLFQSMILAVFLVFIILTVQFKSVAQPFIILTTVPMAAVGVIWGLVITGNDFGFYAFMGLVALVGIAVNDAIVLIDYMNGLRKEGIELKEAIVKGAATRFNPVLATTMTTIAGVLPLAFKEIYYAEFSFALIFGLLVTTVLTLVFVPVSYSIVEGIKIRASLNIQNKKGGVKNEI